MPLPHWAKTPRERDALSLGQAQVSTQVLLTLALCPTSRLPWLARSRVSGSPCSVGPADSLPAPLRRPASRAQPGLKSGGGTSGCLSQPTVNTRASHSPPQSLESPRDSEEGHSLSPPLVCSVSSSKLPACLQGLRLCGSVQGAWGWQGGTSPGSVQPKGARPSSHPRGRLGNPGGEAQPGREGRWTLAGPQTRGQGEGRVAQAPPLHPPMLGPEGLMLG